MLILSHTNELTIPSEGAEEFIKSHKDEFYELIDDHRLHIKEIRSMEGGQEIINAMMSVVSNTLPDADATEIIRYLLEFSPEWYEIYIKWESKKRNLHFWNEIAEKYNEFHKNRLQEYLNNEQLETDFWIYTFNLNSLDHIVTMSTPYEVYISHNNKIQTEIRSRGTWILDRVKEDVVWLQEHYKDIEHEYILVDDAQLTNNLFSCYTTHVETIYDFDHHYPFLEWLSNILSIG